MKVLVVLTILVVGLCVAWAQLGGSGKTNLSRGWGLSPAARGHASAYFGPGQTFGGGAWRVKRGQALLEPKIAGRMALCLTALTQPTTVTQQVRTRPGARYELSLVGLTRNGRDVAVDIDGQRLTLRRMPPAAQSGSAGEADPSECLVGSFIARGDSTSVAITASHFSITVASVSVEPVRTLALETLLDSGHEYMPWLAIIGAAAMALFVLAKLVREWARIISGRWDEPIGA